jgi:ATP-dependent Clp protease ATP-binding subunit ClpX
LFDESALREMAHRAIELNTGARGLRTIMEEALLELMYEIPSDKTIEKIVIDGDCILKKKKPSIIRKISA